MGGRKGPRAPVRLLQPDLPRRRARPTERLRATLDRALGSIPRLRQRVVGAPLRIVPPEFADDPDARPRGPRQRGRRARHPATTARCSTSAARSPNGRSTGPARCGSSRVIEGLTGGRAALLQKIHHTITDGVGGLKLSLALVDFERDPEPVARPTKLRASDDRADDPAAGAADAARRRHAARWSTPPSGASTSCGAASAPPATSSRTRARCRAGRATRPG